MAKCREVGLCPSPAICGNTNHIQWLVLRPRRNSASACSYVPPAACAVTKRSSSGWSRSAMDSDASGCVRFYSEHVSEAPWKAEEAEAGTGSSAGE